MNRHNQVDIEFGRFPQEMTNVGHHTRSMIRSTSMPQNRMREARLMSIIMFVIQMADRYLTAILYDLTLLLRVVVFMPSSRAARL